MQRHNIRDNIQCISHFHTAREYRPAAGHDAVGSLKGMIAIMDV